MTRVAAAAALLLVACAPHGTSRPAPGLPAPTIASAPTRVAVAPAPTAPTPAEVPPAPTSRPPASADGDERIQHPIVQAGDPVLRARAKEVDPAAIRTPEMQALVARMIATMRAAPGVGLAAPQIGVPLRVIVLEDRAELMTRSTPAEVAERERVPFGPRVFFNPVLTPVGGRRVRFFEGCLSVDGWAGIVDRHHEVEVSGLDEDAQPVRWRVRGWPARILQHEVDHIDGTLYLDRMDTRSFSTGAQAKARFGGKPMAEVLRLLGQPAR